MGRTLEERLPREGEPVVSRMGAAVFLVLVVAAVLAVNSFAVRRSPASVRTYDGMLVGKKWDIASRTDAAGGVVVIGDSSGSFGIATDVLEEQLERPAWNLCTYGRFQATGAAWFLGQILKQSSEPPALVLVVLGSRTFALDPDGATFAQIPIDPFGWLSGDPNIGIEPQDAAQFSVARAFPLMSQHRSYRRAILEGAWNPDLSKLAVEPNGTALLPRANPAAVPLFKQKTMEELAAISGPVPSLREREAIRALIRDAQQRGYDMVFVDSPMWTGMYEDPDHAAFLELVHSFIDEACLQEAASAYGRGRAIRLDASLPTYPAEQMENPFHLMPEPSKAFTKAVTDALIARGFPR